MEELLNLVRQLAAVEERLRNLNEERENADDDSRFYIDQQITAQRSERMALEERYYALMDSFGYDEILNKIAPAGRANDLARMSDTEVNLRWRIVNDARIRRQEALAREIANRPDADDTRVIEEEQEVEVLEPVGRVIEEPNASITQMNIQREIERIAAERGRSPEDYTTGPITAGDDTERDGLGDDNPLNYIGIFEKNKKKEIVRKRVREVEKEVEEEQEVEVLEPVGRVIEEANASITQMNIQREIERLAAEKGKSPEDFTTGPITEGDDTQRDGYGDDNPLNYIGIFEKVKKVEKVKKIVKELVEVPFETEKPEKPTERKKDKPEPTPEPPGPEPVPPQRGEIIPPEPPAPDQESQTRGGVIQPDEAKKISIIYDAKKGTYVVTHEDGTTEEYEAKALNMKKQAKIDYIASQIPKEFLDIILTTPIPNMPNKTLKSLDPDLVVILYKEFGGQREGAYAARDYVLSLAGKTRGYDRSSLKYSMTYDLSELGEAKYSNGEPMSAIDRARIINLADANKNVADVKISEKTRIPLFTRIKLGIKNAVSRILKGEKRALPAATEPKAKDEEEPKAKTEEQKDEEPKAKVEEKSKEEVKYGAKLDEKAPKLDLEGTVKYLQECKAKGKNVYIVFNGHKLYSQDVTLESAYIDVTGTPKDVYKDFSKRLKDAEIRGSKQEAEKIKKEWNAERARYREQRRKDQEFTSRVFADPTKYSQDLQDARDTFTTEITPEDAPIRDEK